MWKNIFLKVTGIVLGLGLLAASFVFAPETILVSIGSGLLGGLLGYTIAERNQNNSQATRIANIHQRIDEMQNENTSDLSHSQLNEILSKLSSHETQQKVDNERIETLKSQVEALIRNENSSRQHQERIVQRRQRQDDQALDKNGNCVRFQAPASQSQKGFFSGQPEQASGINLNPTRPRQ